VTLAEDNLSASGTLTLSTGEIIMIDTDQIIDLGNNKELTFTSNDLSFIMTTGEEEEIMEINTVTFRGAESAILVGQSTERAPLNPVLGTYICIDCPAPLNNMLTQTFNLVIAAPDMSGNSAITSQTTLGGTIYNGVATQSGCVVSGGQTTCNLTSGSTPGMVGTAFDPGGGPVNWSGTHTFDNGPSGPNDCSTVSGFWTWNASTIGTVGGTFNSTLSGDCPPPPVTLVFEGFDNAIGTAPVSGYTVRNESENTSGVEFNLNNPGLSADYFGRVSLDELDGDNTSPTPIFFNNIQGARFFGVQDPDQTGNPNGGGFDNQSINWLNLDVSTISSMNVSAFFAESNGAGETWDPTSSARIEYSTDNVNWITILGIESSGSNTAPQIDNPPFDGNGDGTAITDTFTEYTSIDVDVSGINTISVRVIFEALTSNEEDIAIDNLTISGN